MRALATAELHPAELLRRTFAARIADAAVACAEHRVRWADGSAARVELERWFAAPSPPELELLEEAAGPVLDVGCGPGRHAAALARRDLQVLGIDVLPEAVRAGRLAGADIIERSVFDALPGEGAWATVLLLDGNVGIGGHPEALMRRVHEVLSPAGRALLEVEGPGVGVRSDRAWLETPHERSHPFAWGRVGVEGLAALARASGFTVTRSWRSGDRWFARLDAVPG